MRVETKFIDAIPKDVYIGWFSSMAEAYNMAIYSFTAPYLALKLFQDTSEQTGFLFSYLLLFIGTCLLYPLGAVYFGMVGDLKGRQKLCVYATLGLGLSTGLMGFIPFDTFKETAWIFFLVLIALQNFFSGGEYHGSIVFSLEHSSQNNKGLSSALSCLFAVFGLVAANAMAVTASMMDGIVWIRVCFFIGGLGGLISYLLKNYSQETPAFTSLSPEILKVESVTTFIKREWRKIGNVVIVLAFFSVSYSYIFIFLPIVNLEKIGQQNFDTVIILMVYAACLLFSGKLSDKFGIWKVMGIGLKLFSIMIIPICFLCNHIFSLQFILTPCICLVIGPIHSWMLEQFEIKERCRGIFISSAISTSIFGGSTVPICLFIYENTHSLPLCGLYPLMISSIALFYFHPFLKYLRVLNE